MNRLTADNIVKAIEPFRKYLFINEFNKIKECVYFYVESKEEVVVHNSKIYNNKEEEKPLIKFFMWSLNKRIKLPVIVLVLLFVLGIVIGYFI